MSLRRVVSATALLAAVGCGAVATEADWPPVAKKWFDRAQASFRHVDVEDAHIAVQNALRLQPKRDEVRLLAARVALSRLAYDETIRHLEGMVSRDASAIRGRAYWYSGQIERAADELEALLADPEVRDPWAQEVAKLARRGAGRKPFSMSGGLVGVAEMPPVGTGALIVPLELNGEPALSMIATGTPEVVVDSSSGREPSWVSLRFGRKIEVHDVPAMTKDLSGLSRQLNAPIKLLLGVNLLRHIHPTFDYRGSQFVVRTFEPPPPPASTTVQLNYIRGGGMVFRSAFGADADSAKASLLIDTSMVFPVALDDDGWSKAGVKLSTLQSVPNTGGLRQGVLPQMLLGAFAVPQVPGVYGAPLEEFEKGLDVDLDGMVGSGLIGAFRVTLVDGGRTMWLEDAPTGGGASRRPGLPAEGPPSPAGLPPAATPPPGSPLGGGANPSGPG